MTIRDIVVAFGFEVDKTSESQAESAITSLKSTATKLLGSIAVVFSVQKLASFTASCVSAASDVEEMQNKFDVVFDGMTEEVEEWASTFADSIGRNSNTIKGYLADNQNLFVGMGMTRDAASEMSQELVTLALDLASFNNLDEDSAVSAMQKALMGETESAKTLGAVLDDNTRALAMQELGLSGTYDALDSATQMQVNYQAILLQSTDAIGDCARSLDSYKGKQTQLTSAIAEFKEFIGTSLLPILVILMEHMINVVNTLTDFATALIGATEEENRLLKAFNSMYSLVKKLEPALDRMGQTLSNGISTGIDVVSSLADKMGGVENLLQVLCIAAAAFLIVMNWSSIVEFAKNLYKALSGITKLFSLAALKVLAIVAVIVLLALVVEDFIHFLLGNDSVIGTIFDEAGIGADNARQAIFDAWDAVKAFLFAVWDTIKTGVKMYVDAMLAVIDSHSESIVANFMRAWEIIKTFLFGVWTFITQLASTLFGNAESDIDGTTLSTKEKVLAVWQEIVTAIAAILNALLTLYSAVFNAIAAIIEFVFMIIQNFWDSWGATILGLFKGYFDAMSGVINGFLDVIVGLADFITSVFTGDWKGAWEAIKDVFEGLMTMIVNILLMALYNISASVLIVLGILESLWNTVWSNISSFLSTVLNNILTFLQGVLDTVVSVVTAKINAIYSTIVSILAAVYTYWKNIFASISTYVTSTFTSILSSITTSISNIKSAIVSGMTSAIDWIKALPSQAVTWGADIISGLVSGIKNSISKITSAVSDVASAITSYLHFSVPDEGPLTEYESWMPDFMSGLASGIAGSEDTLLDKVEGVASGISALMQGATADASTVATSSINNTTSSVMQNVNISNSYSGGTAETQKNVSDAMKKSATDATTTMARGLAYARG